MFYGFSSGMPLYVWSQLVPAWLRSDGIDLSTIGLLTTITFVYNLKFLWAPLLDRFRMPFLGRRRGWALITQIMCLIAIGLLGQVDPTAALGPAVYLILAVSVASATQDIVLDAYRRELLPDDELGTGTAIWVNAYRISSLVPGSLALILSDVIPWAAVYWVVAAFMLVGVLTTLFVPETADDSTAPPNIVKAVVEPFVEFFTRNGWRSAIAILAFMFLYKLGDNMAVALATPFYIDMGFSLTEIGTIAKFSALWAAIAGSVLGGIIMLKVRINRALWVFGFVQITSIFGFAWLAHVGHNVYVLFAVVSFEYLGVGLGTVALIAYISQQTSIRFTATQFALLTALATLPRTAANASTGFIIEAIGYFNFFLVCAAAAIPGILLLFVVAPWSDTKHPESIP